MDGVGISIIGRPRSLPGHDTPNAAHNTYTLKCEEPLNHRNLAGTPAQGASITSTTTRPWPCAIQPATRAPRQLIARLNIKHQSIWGASHAYQMEALQTDEQITTITTIKQHTAAGRARHRPRSFEDRGGRSPLITWDLDLYPQLPLNTHSPTLNSEEPV